MKCDEDYVREFFSDYAEKALEPVISYTGKRRVDQEDIDRYFREIAKSARDEYDQKILEVAEDVMSLLKVIYDTAEKAADCFSELIESVTGAVEIIVDTLSCYQSENIALKQRHLEDRLKKERLYRAELPRKRYEERLCCTKHT